MHRLTKQRVVVKLKLGHRDLLSLLLGRRLRTVLVIKHVRRFGVRRWRVHGKALVRDPHELLRLQLVQLEQLLVLRLNDETHGRGYYVRTDSWV